MKRKFEYKSRLIFKHKQREHLKVQRKVVAASQDDINFRDETDASAFSSPLFTGVLIKFIELSCSVSELRKVRFLIIKSKDVSQVFRSVNTLWCGHNRPNLNETC